MKKVYLMFLAIGMISIAACGGGPSAEEKAKMEAEAATMKADSMKVDSMMNAAKANMAADSTANASAKDSTAAH